MPARSRTPGHETRHLIPLPPGHDTLTQDASHGLGHRRIAIPAAACEDALSWLGVESPEARLCFALALIFVALVWIALALIVVLPPSSLAVGAALLFLPFGLVLAIVFAWNGQRIGRRSMQARFAERESR